MAKAAGRIAVVTGASSGIGRALALALAAPRWTLCLVARRSRGLEAVAASIRKKGCRAFCYPTDLSQDESIKELKANLRRDVDAIDVLIHSAGVISLGPLEREPVDRLDWQYRVNVRAPYALTQALLPLIKTSRGQIVFINSIAGLAAHAGQAQYGATKHALKAMADSLREEVKPAGVRVLSVFLGKVATPMQAYVHKAEGRAYSPSRLAQPEDIASAVVHALNLPRTVEVTDITMVPLAGPPGPSAETC